VKRPNDTKEIEAKRNKMDYVVYILITVFLIVGVYQFYFWTQDHGFRTPISLETTWDQYIPLKPAWIWVYSGLYYPAIVLIVVTVRDMRHFNYTATSFFFLLFMQMFFFLVLPVKTPGSWREIDGDSLAIRFIRLVQSYDKTSNCFPSMHVSVATLTALHMMNNAPTWGYWPLLFPLLIAISALYTKQHFLADLIPGALLGWFAFWIFQWMYV
jgi:membrane-associated phospholipid phosphatase